MSVHHLPVRMPFAVAVLALALLGGCKADPSDKDIEVISLSDLRSLTSGKDASRVMLVDPRAKSDFDAGHIPGAQNYGINSERAKTGTGLNPVFKGYKHLIVYGDNPSSGPGKAMTKRLMLMEADNVRFFEGGMVEWRRAGLPVEKTPSATLPADGAGDASTKNGTPAK